MGVLDGKVAVVTGGGSGIGRAIAQAFAAEGARVGVGDYFADRAEEAAAAIGKAGGEAFAERIDVSAWTDVDRFVGGAVRRWGRLDFLVSNAGIYDGYADCLATSEALWGRILAVNLTGVFLCCKRGLQEMVTRGGGRIINIASVGGLVGSADGASYTASKFGVIGLTKQIAVTYARQGITCNAICPGVITTQIRDSSARILGPVAPPMQRGVGVSQEVIDRLVPMGRVGLPEEVARVAVFLASGMADYITGQAIVIDGGWTAK